MPNSTDDTRLVTILLGIIGSSVGFPPLFTGYGTMGFGPLTVGMSGGSTWGGRPISGWLCVVGTALRLLFLAAIVGGGYLIHGLWRAARVTRTDRSKHSGSQTVAVARPTRNTNSGGRRSNATRSHDTGAEE